MIEKVLIACPFYPDLLCPFDDCQGTDCGYHPESWQRKRLEIQATQGKGAEP